MLRSVHLSDLELRQGGHHVHQVLRHVQPLHVLQPAVGADTEHGGRVACRASADEEAVVNRGTETDG